MRVIPVLDLKHGLVVRARAGDRAAYAPIETPLAATADPLDVTAGLLGLARFEALYIADLDAIEGRPGNLETVLAIGRRWPTIEIWLDDGLSTAAHLAERLGVDRLRPVIGSESQSDGTVLALAGPRAVLSLDWRGDRFVGPTELLDPQRWPADVIVMTLAQVGTSGGPDFGRLACVQAQAGAQRRVFAAGGVRDLADLLALSERGISGALVATALHAGRITAADLARLDRPGSESR